MTDTGSVTTREVQALSDLLDYPAPPWRAGILPPLAHWLAFPPAARQSDLGRDGHPRRTDHPDLPRRMWAGSRVRFLADVAVDAPLRRATEIVSQVEKTGRSGRMLFVTLRHDISSGGAPAIVEEQDLVYRAMPVPAAAPLPVDPLPYATDDATIVPDAAMLFRFSALTYNAHRIHYDLPYARDVEGYRGLVVHGPLIATLLIDRLRRHRPGATPASFAFRAVAPLIAGERITFSIDQDGATAELTASGPAGIGMSAQATFAP